MTLKQGLKNKDFIRQKKEKRDSGQKEQHEPRPGKAQGKPSERELTWQRCLGQGIDKGKPAKSPVCSSTGLSWARLVLCEARAAAQVLQRSECVGQAEAPQNPGQESCFGMPTACSASDSRQDFRFRANPGLNKITHKAFGTRPSTQ